MRTIIPYSNGIFCFNNDDTNNFVSLDFSVLLCFTIYETMVHVTLLMKHVDRYFSPSVWEIVMAKRHILMGDVIGSSKHDVRQLRKEFMGLVSLCNQKLEHDIISPYTVTLGDEFQGIATSLHAVIEAIFYMEETILRKGLEFKIRYVAVHGAIDTPINRLRAHTMMGAGLTKAREILTDKRRGEPRFRFDLPDAHTMNQLNRLFLVLDGLTGRWDTGDGLLIFDMLANPHNEEVGVTHGKNRTQIWKRRKHLLIEEYRALREAIMELGQ